MHNTRTWPNVAFGAFSMATGANQVRDVASGIAQHRHVHIIQTDTACLATLNEPAYRPDPMQKLHRVPKREPLR